MNTKRLYTGPEQVLLCTSCRRTLPVADFSFMEYLSLMAVQQSDLLDHHFAISVNPATRDCTGNTEGSRISRLLDSVTACQPNMLGSQESSMGRGASLCL